MTRLTVDDARKAGFCVKGQMKWAKRLGIDVKKFIRVGINSDEINHIDDVKLTKALAEAINRESRNGN